MNRAAASVLTALLALAASPVAPAQMSHESAMAPMKHEAGVPSTTLAVTGLNGEAKTLSVAEMKLLPHTTVTVMNGHTKAQESYGGVAVRDLLALVAPAKMVPVTGGDAPIKPRVSPRMTVVVARGTDGFRVALTLCDTDPGCRSGQAIVADSMDGHPLTADGAFKLILTEDKLPGRWVRNLDALTEKNLGAM